MRRFFRIKEMNDSAETVLGLISIEAQIFYCQIEVILGTFRFRLIDPHSIFPPLLQTGIS
jgi:hypothetical protein